MWTGIMQAKKDNSYAQYIIKISTEKAAIALM